MKSVKLHFVHGFLGAPSDWSQTLEFLPNSIDYELHNLWEKPWCLNTENAFQLWANDFLDGLSKNQKHILIGYSLGGRLLLYTLSALQPSFCEGLILISSNPKGLPPEQESERKAWLAQWVHLFQEGAWEDVVHEWNQQPIFEYDNNRPQREESSFSRSLLLGALENWGLHRQRDFSQPILASEVPVFYIHGALDHKYKAIGDGLEGVHMHDVPGGHSPLFSSPEYLASLIQQVVASAEALR